MSNNILLTILIPILNEEVLLRRVLTSAKRLGVDIFILDSGSTDNSLEIAKSYGCQVYSGVWPSFGSKLNWGLNNLPFSSAWVMRLDADEYLTDEFVDQILPMLSSLSSEIDGVIIGRRIKFLNKWLRHGTMYPSEHLRITRVGRAHYEDRLLDEQVKVEGGVYRFNCDIIEEESKGLLNWSRKHLSYAEAECFISYNKLNKTRSWSGLSGTARYRRFMREELYNSFPLFIRPLGFWLYRYVFRLGFLDGIPGLIYHFLHALWYRFLVDALIFEARISGGATVKKSHQA